MNKKHKSISGLVVGTALAMALSIGAYATQGYTGFSGSLPANQEDTEISTVARASSDVDYFNIYFSSLGTGTTNVRAWGEIGYGANVSDPYKQIPFDYNEYIVHYYSNSIPAMGKNVTLNLDNPVVMTSSVSVGGQWKPN